jgi:hypothetical protein
VPVATAGFDGRLPASLPVAITVEFSGNRPPGSFEDTANCDHSNHTILTHEAVFEKSPFAIPAD